MRINLFNNKKCGMKYPKNIYEIWKHRWKKTDGYVFPNLGFNIRYLDV